MTYDCGPLERASTREAGTWSALQISQQQPGRTFAMSKNDYDLPGDGRARNNVFVSSIHD